MQQNEIFNHYKDNFDKNLSNDKLLDWESQEAQFARFNILSEYLKTNSLLSPSLLDVGCGTADLYDYLLQNDIKPNYIGVDILPQMVQIAKNQHPDLNIQCIDIFKDNDFSTTFDIVYSSGIFNIDLGNNYEFLEKAITKFLFYSKKAVIFNLLADTSLDKENGYFYFNKDKVESLLTKLNIKKFSIITGYLHNDMSIIID